MKTDLLRKYLRRSGQLGLMLVVLIVLMAGGQTAYADGPLTTTFTGTGRYAIASAGVGMTDTDTAQITLNVPGTVVQAYLYWAMNDFSPGGDNTIDFGIQGNPPTTLVADGPGESYGPDFWFTQSGNDVYHYVFVEDVTALVVSGPATYEVSGFDALRRRYGAGLLVVYEDPALPWRSIEIKAGLDGAYWNFPDPQGPNTDVTCFQFAADTIDRTFTYTMMAGGVNPRTMSGDERPTALYARIGSGTPPTELINPVDPQRIPIIHGGTDDYPFDSHDGLQWDVLRHTDTNNGALTVPAGATYVCFQGESVATTPTQPLDGASMLVIAMAGGLEVQAPPLAALGDYVWFDNDRDGIQDAGEAGVPGVTVRLYNGAGTLLATDVTDASGLYLFDNLQPGDYFVEFVPPSGYVVTARDQGGDDTVDSDADPATGRTIVTNLIAGERDMTWDAGIYQPTTNTPTPTPTVPSLTPTPFGTPFIPPTPQATPGSSDPTCNKVGEPESITPGEVVRWTIIATNPTGTAIPNATVDDVLDGNIFAQVVEATTTKGTAAVTGLRVVFTIGTLEPGETVTMTIVGRARQDIVPPVTSLNQASLIAGAQTICVAGDNVTVVGGPETLPATGYPPAATNDPFSITRLWPLAAVLTLMLVGWLGTRRFR
ncbi:MAG: DUF3344 domain-containing protein [Chloroflexi bacterium]|nr:DUF3344 domain-containing protein [Chloroflexota bacterium]